MEHQQSYNEFVEFCNIFARKKQSTENGGAVSEANKKEMSQKEFEKLNVTEAMGQLIKENKPLSS